MGADEPEALGGHEEDCDRLRANLEWKTSLSVTHAALARGINPNEVDKHKSVNAMAERFVDTFQTALIKNRIWQTRPQVELAILKYISWFKNDRLHESLGDIPPVELETAWAARRSGLPQR